MGHGPGAALPPLWHWLYFLPMHRQSENGADGHAKRGGFLPPVPLPRRMWVGGQFEFRSPVRVGDRVARTSTIADVSSKQGGSGQLVFVKVRHELRCNDAAADSDPALVEFHDIVYRDAQRADDVPPPPQADDTGAPWQREIVPDDVLLRRHLPQADVAAFRFKAVRPTFDLHPFRVNGRLQPDGKTVRLWAQDHEGWLTMDATATLR